MRKRICAAMMALVLVLFPTGMLLVTRYSFQLMMERERFRALSEEAAIARAVSMEAGSGEFAQLQQLAQALQQKYGSPSLRVMLLYHGQGMLGMTVPEAAQPLLEGMQTRATLLDAASQQLLIAHRLNSAVTLLIASDVSPVYALRAQLQRWTALLCGVGLIAAIPASLALSGFVARPLRMLSRAAQALARGEDGAHLPPVRNDEIGELTNAFDAMAQAVRRREHSLKQQSERQQAMIDAMAHEMRTPLTAIIAGCRLLRRAALSQRQQAEVLDMAAREAQRLSTMDERLLLLTKLRGGALVCKPFSLLEMAKEALCITPGVVLEGEDASLCAERELMIELLRNLVANAQRSGSTTPVRVLLHADGFTVADTGCGMTPEQAARAFEPFYKADQARTRQAGGAGLGLTLCRQIAQLHGGTLSLTSAPGKGTEVRYHNGKEN